MKTVNRTICALIMAALLCAILGTSALAAENGSMWLNVTNAADGTTVASIEADTTVTDGYVELAYDSACLTYTGVTVNDTYVAMYSVNADTAGVVKIAWVAPGAWESDGTGVILLQVHFSGDAGQSTLRLTGSANNAQGSPVLLRLTDTTALEAAIAKAEALNSALYTEDSFAAVNNALAEAKAVLADSDASQEQVDAATAALNDAVSALVADGDNSQTGDDSPLLLMAGLMLLCAVGIVVVVVLMKKKGGRKE